MLYFHFSQGTYSIFLRSHELLTRNGSYDHTHATQALKRKCCRDPNGEGDSMCLDSCPMMLLQEEEVEESMYAYTVKILSDDLSVRTAGQPKDWAATWTLSD